jgi:hypothetical protein
LKGFPEFRKFPEELTAWRYGSEGAVSEALVAGVTIIVSREEPNRCTYFRHVFGSEIVFGSEGVDVILDRRLGQRRQPNHARAEAERRRADRRRCGVARDLRTLGWALVRR